MTNKTKTIVWGAVIALASYVPFVPAQDDLDALLNELDPAKEATTVEKKASPQEAKAPAAEADTSKEVAPAAEEKEAEQPKAEETSDEKAAAVLAEEGKEAKEVAEAEEAPAPAEEAKEADTPKAEEVAAHTEEPSPAGEEPVPAEKAEAKADPSSKSNAPMLGDLAASANVKVKAAEPPHPDAELLANVVATEVNRGMARAKQAEQDMIEARKSMREGAFLEALRHYNAAENLLTSHERDRMHKLECKQGGAEALLRQAVKEWKLGQKDHAIEHINGAIERGHPKANRIKERWESELQNPSYAASAQEDSEAGKHRFDDEDYKKRRESIRKHLKRSAQYFAAGELDKALEEAETVLVGDKYNTEAIRMRKNIIARRKSILQKERVAARDGLIADVDEAWRPVYAVNAGSLEEGSSETVKFSAGDDPERTSEQAIIERMKAIRLPEIKFNPPATIMDAVQFFHQASKDYDNPALPVEERGFNFFLRPPTQLKAAEENTLESANDFTDTGAEENTEKAAHGLAPIPTIAANNISFYEALKLVCDSVDYKFIIRGSVVMVMHKDSSTAEILARKYNVPESFIERVSSASEEIKTMGGFGANANNNNGKENEEAAPDQDWKAFFSEMGVKWPEGSSIKHIKSLGKLYVRNTRENLAEFEKVLDELGGQPQLIEIETRFVEVSQEDLNSLGFEWILNDNYTFGLGRHVGKALGLKSADYVTTTSGETTQNSFTYNADGTVNTITTTVTPGTKTPVWQKVPGGSAKKQIGINAFGGTSDYGNGSRYLSTEGNHISGEGMKTNDQFMRLNAFLGDADLSMILHMLSQRSDTDLLSAPKVVTQSGQQAVIKVVTEFIYPQDYDVQLQSSSSSSGSSYGGSGSQSAILAVVEPQNFTMREVGVILDVTPTYSEANGGSIDLELKPQVVDEPSWRNYGMKIPFTGNSSLQNFEGLGGIFDGLSAIFNTLGQAIPTATKAALAESAMTSADTALQQLANSGDNITYYDAPMEQPFFHVRSIESRVSITPGSTVVMGGLITEQRKAMDDKVPFLGDLPFIGRLFRSHAEQTIKRNLLVFVTGRLITPSGRELKLNDQSSNDQQVKAAPSGK